MEKVAIVDYGMSNLHSVFSALKKVSDNDFEFEITQDPNVIENSDRIIFPGQGAAADCMHQIHSFELAGSIRKSAQEKPFLGICMGMQVLLDSSAENGGTECLGLIPGTVNSFSIEHNKNDNNSYKIPHMGWNTIDQKIDHPVWKGVEQNSYFYFVHSYYVELDDDKQIAGRSHYGKIFTSALAHKNLFATQFHPEKSAKPGARVLKIFLRLST